MRWKRGDVVRVKPEATIKLYNGVSIDQYPWYRQWCGKTVTILGVMDDNSYVIDGYDTMRHDLWIDESFEEQRANWNPLDSIEEYESIW